MRDKNQNGFIALISAIIISVILLLVVTTTSLTSFYGRSNILESEFKERSLSIAEACVDQAFLAIANDSSYGGNQDVTIGSDHCHIGGLTGSDPRIFKTQGVFQNSYTNLQIAVHPDTLGVVSWEETPN